MRVFKHTAIREKQQEINIQILHLSFYQNYQMNLSDIYQILHIGKKCCVYAYITNYYFEKLKCGKTPAYRFLKDETEK